MRDPESRLRSAIINVYLVFASQAKAHREVLDRTLPKFWDAMRDLQIAAADPTADLAREVYEQSVHLGRPEDMTYDTICRMALEELYEAQSAACRAPRQLQGAAWDE